MSQDPYCTVFVIHFCCVSLANDFNRHFVAVLSVFPFPSNAGTCHTVFVVPCPPSMVSPPPTSPACPFDVQAISCDQCVDLINSLQVNKTTGPDNIPSSVLKCAKSIMAPPLTSIINSSFSSGCFPNRWKRAWVKPLHKGGTKDQHTNYCPISLLPISSKLIEQVVRTQLNSHLESNNFIHPLQSGFRKKHSTATTLLRSTNDWLNTLDKGLFVGVIFLDVSKPLTLSTMAYYLANCPNAVLCPPSFSGSSRIFPIDPSAQLLLESSPNPCRLLLVYLKAQFLVPICSQCISMIYPLSFHQIVPQFSLLMILLSTQLGQQSITSPVPCPLPSPSATSG